MKQTVSGDPRLEKQLGAAWQNFSKRVTELQLDYQRRVNEISDTYGASWRSAIGQADCSRLLQDAYSAYVKEWLDLNSTESRQGWESRYQDAWKMYLKELQAVCARIGDESLEARDLALMGQYLSMSSYYCSNLPAPREGGVVPG